MKRKSHIFLYCNCIMVKLGKHHPYVTSVPRQNRCATCNIRPRGYQVVHVYGNIASNLTIVDGQELIIDTTVIIDVGVTLLIQRGARLTITNTGSLFNNGTLSVETGAVFTNNGMFTNGTPPLMQLLQSQQNMFATTNSHMFALTEPPINPDTNYDSMFSLMWYYTSQYFNQLVSRFVYDSSSKYKAIEEDPVSYFFNAGTFINTVGSTCINATNGVISNTGLFNNNGSVDNTGTIDNSGLLDNNNGLINNTGGTINNTGAVTNSGTGAIDGGTYTGPPPSGNPVVPTPPPPPPSGSPLVGSIFAFGPLPFLPVYWADGDINNQPINLNIPSDEFIYGAMSVSATTGRIVGIRSDSSNNYTAITWENSESVEPIVLPLLYPPASSRCYSISSNGSTIVGKVNQDALGYDIACIWQVSGNTIAAVNLEPTNPNNYVSSAFTCNSNGSIVYGLYNSAVCKWTKLVDGSYTRTLVYTPLEDVLARPIGIVDENTLCLIIEGGDLPRRYGYLNIETSTITLVPSDPAIIIQASFTGINTTGTSFYGLQIDYTTNPPGGILLQVEGDTISQLPLPSYIGTGAYTDYGAVTVGFF